MTDGSSEVLCSFLDKGPNWIPDYLLKLEKFQEFHLDHQAAPFESGKMSGSGPVEVDEGSDEVELIFINPDTFAALEVVRIPSEADPMF